MMRLDKRWICEGRREIACEVPGAITGGEMEAGQGRIMGYPIAASGLLWPVCLF